MLKIPALLQREPKLLPHVSRSWFGGMHTWELCLKGLRSISFPWELLRFGVFCIPGMLSTPRQTFLGNH